MGQSLRNKLTAIHVELCTYSEQVFKNMDKNKYFIVSVKYGVMLQAIHDLHAGTLYQQLKATEYFKSRQYIKDCKDVGIDVDTMDHIVYSVDQYADKIGYIEPADEDILVDGE